MDNLVIGGITMPSLKKDGLEIKKEKVWSKNTGRAANGDMIGDIIKIKYTLHCEWPPLNKGDAAKIDAAVSPLFFNVTFTDIGGGRVTRVFYAGTPVYPVYSYVSGVKTYQGVTVDLIEK
uniref:hypothetical protein n=1 Tax=Faecalicatena contorta TaxID=39482 RepID=UPI0029220436|nr:hypothetical protein AUSP0088_00057 [uncultured phage]